MKRIAFILLLLSSSAFAQNFSPVVATKIEDASGNLLQSGTIYFQPVDAAYRPTNFMAGGGGTVHSAPVLRTVINGVMQGTLNIASSSYSSPMGIQYKVYVTDDVAGTTMMLGYAYICTTSGDSRCQAGTWSLDNWTPNNVQTLSYAGPSFITGALTASGDVTAPHFHGLADASMTSQAWAVLPQQCPSGYSSSHFDIHGNALDCNANSFQPSGTTTGVIAQAPAGNQMVTLVPGAHQRFGSAASYLDVDAMGDAATPGSLSSSSVNGTMNLAACGASIAPAWCPTTGVQDISSWEGVTVSQGPLVTLSNGTQVHQTILNLSPGTVYSFAGPITLSQFVRINCNGAILNYTGVTGAAFVAAQNSSNQPNDFGTGGLFGPCQINGPGASASPSVTGLTVQVNSNQLTLSGSIPTSIVSAVAAGPVHLTIAPDSMTNLSTSSINFLAGADLLVLQGNATSSVITISYTHANVGPVTDATLTAVIPSVGIYNGGDPYNIYSASTAFGNFLCFNNVAVSGFYVDYQTGSNKWSTCHDDLQVRNAHIGIYLADTIGKTNFNELDVYQNAKIFDGVIGILQSDGGEAAFIGSNCDYNSFGCLVGQKVYLYGLYDHFEQSANYMFRLLGGASFAHQLHLIAGTNGITGAGPTTLSGFILDNGSGSNIYLDHVGFGANSGTVIQAIVDNTNTSGADHINNVAPRWTSFTEWPLALVPANNVNPAVNWGKYQFADPASVSGANSFTALTIAMGSSIGGAFSNPGAFLGYNHFNGTNNEVDLVNYSASPGSGNGGFCFWGLTTGTFPSGGVGNPVCFDSQGNMTGVHNITLTGGIFTNLSSQNIQLGSPAASSGNNQSPGHYVLAGNCWTGTASTGSNWTFMQTVGLTTDTLALAHGGGVGCGLANIVDLTAVPQLKLGPSVQINGGVAITNSSNVMQTTATAGSGTCTANGFISVPVNGVTLHVATCN